MTLQNSFTLALVGVLGACAHSPAPGSAAPVMAVLECAHGVVERYGFLAEEGTDWFPWRPPPSGAVGFTVQRGNTLGSERVSVSVVSNPASGAVDAQASASGSWLNAGEPVRSANSAADYVARRVHEECSVAEPSA